VHIDLIQPSGGSYTAALRTFSGFVVFVVLLCGINMSHSGCVKTSEIIYFCNFARF